MNLEWFKHQIKGYSDRELLAQYDNQLDIIEALYGNLESAFFEEKDFICDQLKEEESIKYLLREEANRRNLTFD